MTDLEKTRQAQQKRTQEMRDFVDNKAMFGKAINPKLTGAYYHFTRIRDSKKNTISLVMQSWN